MTVSYVSRANQAFTAATTIVLPKPTGTVDNDVMIAVVHSGLTSGQTITPPAGWTTLYNPGPNVSVGTIGVFYKLAASEGANFTFTLSASDNGAGVIHTYRGADPSGPVGNFASATQASAVAQIAPTTTPTRAGMVMAAVVTTFNTNQAYSAVDNAFTLRHPGRPEAATSQGTADNTSTGGVATGATTFTADVANAYFGMQVAIYEPATQTHQMVV